MRVMERLTAYVYKLYLTAGLLRDEPLRPTGKSPEDYAQAALTRFLDPRDPSVAWSGDRGKPTTDGVFAYLREVVKNDFIDDRRPRSPHRRTRAIEVSGLSEGTTALAVDPPDPRPPTAGDLVGKVDRDRLFTALLEGASGDVDLEEYLWLQYDSDGYHAYPPRRAAELLKTTVEDINNRKKRCANLFKRFLASGRPERDAAETAEPKGARQ